MRTRRVLYALRSRAYHPRYTGDVPRLVPLAGIMNHANGYKGLQHAHHLDPSAPGGRVMLHHMHAAEHDYAQGDELLAAYDQGTGVCNAKLL